MIKYPRGHGADAGSEELALRFVNTLAWRNAATPEERLPDAESLVEWLVNSEIISPQTAGRLRKKGTRQKVEAGTVHRQALGLREALARLFMARTRSLTPSPEDLHVLNRILAESKPRIAALQEEAASGPTWRLLPSEGAANEILAPIAWSAAELLTGPRATRVRQCADERGCGAMFLDQSRLNNRRWCSMGDCGNRAKAKRHYLRKKQNPNAQSARANKAVRIKD